MRGDARALEGIPTSLKDEDAIAGRPVTADSVLMKDTTAVGAVRHALPAHISFPELARLHASTVSRS
jgi:hypothetical protein